MWITLGSEGGLRIPIDNADVHESAREARGKVCFPGGHRTVSVGSLIGIECTSFLNSSRSDILSTYKQTIRGVYAKFIFKGLPVA